MSYSDQLKKSAKWLAKVRNADNGWGLAQGQASSIVNTSEAIYVLDKLQSIEYDSMIADGIRFIETKTLASVKKKPNTRYVFFALLCCKDHQKDVNPKFLHDALNWLIKARNKDGAWGHAANDDQSRLYPTVMCILCLHAFGFLSEIEAACNWIISKKGPVGWSFANEENASAIATAQATVALSKYLDRHHEVFVKPKEMLLLASPHGVEAENMPGTPWTHCGLMWISQALTSLGVDPYCKPISEGIRQLNILNSESGWEEPGGHLTVRGQYWAVHALHELRNSYDPSVHTYQIDSAIAESELREPLFVRINVHKKWSFAVPTPFYQGVTYGLILISVVFFFGFHRLLTSTYDLVIAIIGFSGAFYLSKKRPKLFYPWFNNLTTAIFFIFSVIGLISGLSVIQLYEIAREFIRSVAGV